VVRHCWHMQSAYYVMLTRQQCWTAKLIFWLTDKPRLLLFCFSVLFHMYEALKQTQNKKICFVLGLFWIFFAMFCFSCKSRFSHSTLIYLWFNTVAPFSLACWYTLCLHHPPYGCHCPPPTTWMHWHELTYFSRRQWGFVKILFYYMHNSLNIYVPQNTAKSCKDLQINKSAAKPSQRCHL